MSDAPVVFQNTEDELAWVKAAIYKVQQGAQEYYIGGRRVTYPALEVLYARERELQARLASETYDDRAFGRYERR